MIDLMRFCAADGFGRGERPFSRGDFTYATNGAIMVRVPLLAQWPDDPTVPWWSSSDPQIQFHVDGRRRVYLVRPAVWKYETCDECIGDAYWRGVEPAQEAPDCVFCGGTGLVIGHERIRQHTGFVANQMIVHWIHDLPGLKVYLPDGSSRRRNVGFFEFDGGCGIFMGMVDRSGKGWC